jgi:putative ABC transport system permease protein
MGPRQYLVAGIMPASFRFGAVAVDFWAPFAYQPEQFREVRQAHYLRAVARLRPGVTLEAARADMTAIASALEREYPNTNTKMGVGLGPLDDWFVGDVRVALLVFLGAVGCLLLIACANVTNLMLSRAIGRTREMAIRTALGAARLRLIRQLLTESLLLSLAGGALGTAVAVWGVRAFAALAPPNLPRLADVHVDGWVLAFTAALTCATALLFGLAPALHVARTEASEALYAGTRGGGARGRFSRRALVVGEVALAFVLVVGAALLGRSFVRLQHVNPGFDPTNVLTAAISLPGQYDTDTKAQQFYERAIQKVRAIPLVHAAGASTRIALDGYLWTGDLVIEGRPEVWGRELRHKAIVPGYFETMGLPLLSGRSFTSFDDEKAPRVAVVNQVLARVYFPGEDPVGRRISFTKPGRPPKWVTIIGVVGNEKQDGLDAPVHEEVYATHLQEADTDMTLVIRCATDPAVVAPLVRRAVAEVDDKVALYNVKTMEERLSDAVARQRLNVWLFLFFGCTALTLAAIGVGGVVAFSVASRTKEIGVRVALGATRGEVLRLVVGDGMRLAAAGLILGLGLALVGVRALSTLLFQTSVTDPLTFVTVAAFLLGVALLAGYLPARTALRVEPVRVLRME